MSNLIIRKNIKTALILFPTQRSEPLKTIYEDSLQQVGVLYFIPLYYNYFIFIKI